jgi:hypothetical protein
MCALADIQFAHRVEDLARGLLDIAYFQHSIFKDMCALADIAILCITKRSGYSWTKKKKRRG